MIKIVLDFSEDVLSARRKSPEAFGAEMRLTAALAWYQKGDISQEEAAQIAGLDRQAFLAVLADRNIDVSQMDFDRDNAKKKVFFERVEAHQVHLPEDYSFNRDELYE